MKEYPERAFGKLGQERLTSTPRNLTLRSEGTSMAENRGEQAPKPQIAPEKTVERLQRKVNEGEGVKEAWERQSFMPWEKVHPDVKNAFISSGAARSGPGTMRGAPEPPGSRAEEAADRFERIARGEIPPGPTPPEPTADLGETDGEESSAGMREMLRRNKLILTNPDFREDYFNQLFSSTYAYPDRAFNEIFSPFYGQGRQYDDFMSLIQQGSVGRFDIFEHDPDFTPEEKRRIQKELEDDLTRFQKERAVIQAVHDASRVLFYPSVDAKSYLESIQQFDSKGGDVAFRTPGVNQMMNIMENVLRETMAKNNGFLPPEAISGKVETEERVVEGEVVKVVKKVTRGDVEEEVKKRYREWAKKQLVVSRGRDGKAYATPELRDPQKWEIEKTFSMARGMMLIDSRLVSIMAESTQPEGTAQYASQFLQDILQGWSGFQHLTGKYGLTRDDMALLLFNDKNIKKVLGLSIWNPKDLKEVLERYKADPRSVLENTLAADPNELFYIMRENPFKAGDIFTWISWRLNPALKSNGAEAVESMIKDFIDKGRARMRARLDGRGGTPPPGLSEADYLKEYENWIGTGIRFEKLRGDMASLEAKKSKPAIEKGQAILKRMSEIQGYRLYSLSKYLRDRLQESGALSTYSQPEIDNALKNLSLVEAALLKDRENILDAGGTFDSVSLSDYYDTIVELNRDGGIDEEATARARAVARALVEEIAADFRHDPEKYYEEFISKREYRHGFVLWSGDAPIDEFNFSRLAPTGGFARRARDNGHQAEASGKVLKLMSSLKHVRSMEDLMKPLAEIHDEIALYDPGKADQSMVDLAHALVKFYSERATTKIPVYGVLERMFGKEISFAKMVHGKGAMAWSATEAAVFIDQLRNMNYITEEQEKLLKEKVPAGKIDFLADSGSFLTQLLLLWVLGYIAEKIVRER